MPSGKRILAIISTNIAFIGENTVLILRYWYLTDIGRVLARISHGKSNKIKIGV